MAATADSLGRESKLAACGLPLHGRVRSAAVDGVADGDNFFTLARDISPNLLTGTLGDESLNAVINGLADLHSADVDVDGGIWCPLEPRIRLLRQGIDMLPQDRDAHGLIRDVKGGWDIFHRIAPRELDELLSAVSRDFGILLRGLAELPVVLLHGDLKLDNLGLDADRTLWLIDWALVARGPACVDIGWFIAANADRIDAGPEQVLSLYSRRVGLEGGARRRHESLAALCGIMLRGWRMALDAASGIRREHFVWWCELAGDAVQFL